MAKPSRQSTWRTCNSRRDATATGVRLSRIKIAQSRNSMPSTFSCQSDNSTINADRMAHPVPNMHRDDALRTAVHFPVARQSKLTSSTRGLDVRAPWQPPSRYCTLELTLHFDSSRRTNELRAVVTDVVADG